MGKEQKQNSFKTKGKGLLLSLFGVLFFLSFSILAEDLLNLKDITASSERTRIYFFNPEINTASYSVLKSNWDLYLYEHGLYEFQPVESSDYFSHLIKHDEQAAFIMSDWFFSSMFSETERKKLGLELRFYGAKNGEDTYSKILVSRKSDIDFSKVTLACAGSAARAKTIIGDIYPELSQEQINQLKILNVPKDIDALMAVGYGLADLALSTELGYSKIASLNPNVYKDMIVVRESKPYKRSVLVFKLSNTDLKQKLENILLKMKNLPSGLNALSLIGLDEWKIADKKWAYSLLKDESVMNQGGHQNDK